MNTLTKGWPTIGEEVLKVEKKIQKYLKVKNAIMLNSGGSANFLILYLLTSIYASYENKKNVCVVGDGGGGVDAVGGGCYCYIPCPGG